MAVTFRIGFEACVFAYFATVIPVAAQPDTVRISQLLKDGSYYVLKLGNEKSDLDSALVFFNQALTVSRSIKSDRWINATLEWKGDCYLEGNHLALGEECFKEVIGYYHSKSDQRREADTWSRLADCITGDNLELAAEKTKSRSGMRDSCMWPSAIH